MRASVGAFNLAGCDRFHQQVRVLPIAAFEFLNDGTVGPFVAVTAFGQMLEREAHLVELARLAPKLGRPGERQRFSRPRSSGCGPATAPAAA